MVLRIATRQHRNLGIALIHRHGYAGPGGGGRAKPGQCG